ncbi:MAG TPA: PucR family transcriptional regulator ligand-binding domain-containing protein [Thermaerobacter sp.]
MKAHWPPHGGSSITLSDALQLEPLRQLKVLAGAAGLDRPVRLVNVIEVPDIVDWVLEGELLLTTGFTFRDHPDRLATLIPGLAAKGAAGLGIKPRRYVAAVPEFLLAQADEHRFPLLEIPYHLSFSEIIGPVMQAIGHLQASVALEVDRVQRLLLDLVRQGAGLEELCGAVGRLLGRPVWIEDDHGQVLTSGERDAGPAAAGGAEARRAAVRVPIATGARFFGYLCTSAGQQPLGTVEAGTLERGAAIIALELGKQEAVIEVKRKYRKEFLDQLLSGLPVDPDEAHEQARALGWRLDRPHTAIFFGPLTAAAGTSHSARLSLPGGDGVQPGRDAGTSARRLAPELRRALLRAAEMVLAVDGNEPVVSSKDGGVVALVTEDPSSEAGRLRILTLAKAVLRSFSSSAGHGLSGGGVPVGAGIGRPAADLTQTARSYREARTALAAAAAARDGEAVLFFADLGVYRLLHNQPLDELEQFVRDFLGPLLDYDRKHDGRLLETLAAYLRYGGNIKRISRALYAHYNTITYRLQRIQQISGLDLKNPEHLLNAHVALKALHLLPGSRPAGQRDAAGPVPGSGRLSLS